MGIIKDIGNVSLVIQSMNLASENIKLANKKKKTTKDFVDVGIKNIVGTSLIKAQSDIWGEF